MNKVLLENMPSMTPGSVGMTSPKNHFPIPTQLLQSSRDEELASHYGDAEENNHLMESIEVDLKLKPKGFPAGPTNSLNYNNITATL